ncbi:MAG: sugar kinase [Candidatus Rokubacteria bacterium]|nr:sugar kinase [Candidatus Rokubacteria bacterium]
MLDVITLGETMVRLAPKGSLRLEQAWELEVGPGGAESNVAVALARLGLRAGWISKLPEHPLSRLIVGEIRRHGVDTSRVVWSGEGRVGTYFYERGVPPRPPRIWYDRKDSAVTTLEDAEVDWAYLRSARAVLVTGITPALSPRLRALTKRVAREVRAAGKLFVLDVNYRAKLWSPQEAPACLEEFLPEVSILFSSRGDAERVFGLAGEPEAKARAFQAKFGVPTVVLTLGAEGSLALEERVYHQRRIPRVEIVDPVGAGDAFAAGFLYGYLGEGVQRGLDMGGAMGALASAIVGDFALLTRAEVEELLASEDQEIRR